MKLKLFWQKYFLCLRGCAFWGNACNKIDYAVWKRLMWLLIGMISLKTEIPEIHSSMNDINIRFLVLAGIKTNKKYQCVTQKLSKICNLELIYWIKLCQVACWITWMHIEGIWRSNTIFIFPSKIFTNLVIWNYLPITHKISNLIEP